MERLGVCGTVPLELVPKALILKSEPIDDPLETLPKFPTLSEALKLTAMAFTRDISKVSCCV